MTSELYEILTKVRQLRAESHEALSLGSEGLGMGAYYLMRGSIAGYDEVIHLLTMEIGRLEVAAS